MITCYFDGACEPKNPGGNMGIGAYIMVDKERVYEYSNHIPASRDNSNNVAEYLALEKVLEFLQTNSFRDEVIFIKGDSNLVVQQMAGNWRIKQGRYKETALRCQRLAIEIRTRHKLIFKWIPREENKEADLLSKNTLKKHVKFKIQADA